MNSPWLRCLEARSQAQVRCLLIPHAGGGPSFFRGWAPDMPAHIEPWALQLPGRETRFKERPYTHMTPLVNDLTAVLGPWNDKPLMVFGHSLGALIAYELARRLPTVLWLGVSSARGPTCPRRRSPLHQLTDEALRRELSRLGGTPGAVLANDELYQLYLPTLRADLEILESYLHDPATPLRCPISVFGGTTDPWADADELLSWTDVGKVAGCWLRPGGHFYLNEHRPAALRAGRVAATIELHLLDLDSACAGDCLNEAERARAERFLKPELRRRFIAARTALRTILGSRIQDDAARVPLHTTVHGKPFLEPNPKGCGFNLSHSGDSGLLAISDHGEVGIDIEQYRDNVAGPDLARRYFSPAEVDDLMSRPADERQARFFAYWSAKEAYIKARGLGLHIPLDQFDVQLCDGNAEALVVDRHAPEQSGRWRVYPLNIRAGFAAAVAARPGINEFMLHRWPKGYL